MLQASELILNSRGAVYHLDLLPEELAPVVFFVGDPDRVAKVSKYFDRIDTIRQHREFVTHTGEIGGRRYTVLSTGIGTDNIDIVVNELDTLANISLDSRMPRTELTSLQIVRIGTSGSMHEAIPVDAFVVSDHAIGTDGLLNYYAYTPSEQEQSLLQAFSEQMQYPAQLAAPYAIGGDTELVKALESDAVRGITVTASGFYAPQGRTLRYAMAYPGLMNQYRNVQWNGLQVTNFEMETAGIYGLSKLLGHRACSISAIVANRAAGTFSVKSDETIDRLIRYTLENVHALK